MSFIPDETGFTPDKEEQSGFIPDKDPNPKGLAAIKEHPFKSIITPLATTLTGQSFQDRLIEANEPNFIPPDNPVAFWKAFAKSAIGGIAGEVADIATTPISLLPLPFAKTATKAISKIPVKGTILGQVAKKVPLKQLFNEDLKAVVSYQNALRSTARRKAQAQSPAVIIGNVADQKLVARVTAKVSASTSVRENQAILNQQLRSKQAGILEKINREHPGLEGHIKSKAALKGIVSESADFTPLGVSQPDIDSMIKMISKSNQLTVHEKLAARDAFMQLAGETGGRVPTESGLNLLGKVFPSNFIRTVAKKKPALSEKGEMFGQILNLPRSMMTTWDLSFPLRQGLFLINRPKQWLPAFGNMFKYFGSERSYQGLLDDIATRPNSKLMKKAGVSITKLGSKLADREEAFMSSLAEKIPFYGKGVRGSNRAASGFINKLRADVFDDFVKVAKEQDIPLSKKLLKDMGGFINASTGRGNLPEFLKGSSTFLNAAFFSPKLMSSRLTLMNPAYYTQLDPFVRKEALRSLFTLAGTAGTVLSLASLGGAEVENDPRSADFAKVKVGNTRYDILGGFQQYMRLAAQLITGEHISSTTGVKTTVGEGFKPLTRPQILGRFLQNKEAPLLALGSRLFAGEGPGGEDLDLVNEAVNLFMPMVAKDMAELAQEKGGLGVAMSIPAVFGMGIQTYEASPSEIVYSARAAIRQAKKLSKQGDGEGSNKLIVDNSEIIRLARKLTRTQDVLRKWQRRADEVAMSKRLTNKQKLEQKQVIDINIQDLEARMEAIVQQDELRKQ